MTEVIELRQYTLHAGERDHLITLFEREFLLPLEQAGMRVLGQFRDLDDPDRFVWFRSFPDMIRRREALETFYGGPVWKAHRDEANGTMIDSDDVLLLRMVRPQFPFPDRLESVPLVLTVHDLIGEVPDIAAPLMQTEHQENTFPALPVRGGENVLVSFQPGIVDLPVKQRLRLEPTSRSALH